MYFYDILPYSEIGLRSEQSLNWSKYAEFLTFRGGLDPTTGGLWLTDIALLHLLPFSLAML